MTFVKIVIGPLGMVGCQKSGHFSAMKYFGFIMMKRSVKATIKKIWINNFCDLLELERFLVEVACGKRNVNRMVVFYNIHNTNRSMKRRFKHEITCRRRRKWNRLCIRYCC